MCGGTYLDPSPWKAKAIEYRVQVQLGLHREMIVSRKLKTREVSTNTSCADLNLKFTSTYAFCAHHQCAVVRIFLLMIKEPFLVTCEFLIDFSSTAFCGYSLNSFGFPAKTQFL